MNLINNFENIVSEYENNIAIIDQEGNITYKELNNEINFLSNLILNKYYDKFKKQISNESIISVCIDRSYKFISSIYSILKINCAYCAISYDYPDDRISYMINDTSSEIIIVDNKIFT